MYIPSAFKEEREDLIFTLIQQNPFGMVVTAADGIPCVNHIPMLLAPEQRAVHFHLAAQNPQLAQLRAGQPVTLVFHGPHAYVSPTWYEQPGVPTWNFMAVHVSGVAQEVTPEELASHMHEMVTRFEGRPGLEGFEGVPAYNKMLTAIVGFTLPLDQVEAKFKLSQNRSRADQLTVAHKLLDSVDASAQATGRIMLELLGEGV